MQILSAQRMLGLLCHYVCVCVLLGATTLMSPGFAAEALSATVTRRLGEYPIVRAEFVQTKTMAALKRPLVTSGHLLFSRRDGVLWRIEKPYQLVYVMRENSVTEIAPDMSKRTRAASDIPGFAQINRVFRGLLRADIVALEDLFTSSIKGDEKHWEMKLTPRSTQVAQTIRNVLVRGGDFIESIRIEEARGDVTLIELHHSQSGIEPNADEARLLALQ